MIEKDETCPDGITPDDMEVVAGDDKNVNNEKNYDEKEVACLDYTTPDDMKIGAGDDKNDKDDELNDEK